MNFDLAMSELLRGNALRRTATAQTTYIKMVGGLLKEFTGATGYPDPVGGSSAPRALTDADLTATDWQST